MDRIEEQAIKDKGISNNAKTRAEIDAEYDAQLPEEAKWIKDTDNHSERQIVVRGTPEQNAQDLIDEVVREEEIKQERAEVRASVLSP